MRVGRRSTRGVENGCNVRCGEPQVQNIVQKPPQIGLLQCCQRGAKHDFAGQSRAIRAANSRLRALDLNPIIVGSSGVVAVDIAIEPIGAGPLVAANAAEERPQTPMERKTG
jgi:hypothetical protein